MELESSDGFRDRLTNAMKEKNGGKLHGAVSALARHAGVTPQAAAKWFSGEQFPRDAALTLVANYLNVTPEWLKFGTPGRPPLPEPEYFLIYVVPAEAELVTDYRESTETGKRQMRVLGKTVDKLPASELPSKRDAGAD